MSAHDQTTNKSSLTEEVSKEEHPKKKVKIEDTSASDAVNKFNPGPGLYCWFLFL